MASPDKKIRELQRQLAESLDTLDDLNSRERSDGRDIAALLCGTQCRIWHIKTSIALRTGEEGVAEKCQRKAENWEKARAQAEREREKEILHEIMRLFDEQKSAVQAAQGLNDADIPDFDPADE